MTAPARTDPATAGSATASPATTGLVWRTRPIGDEPSVDDWAWLPEQDACHAARFTNHATMTRYVTGRALLRETLARLRPGIHAHDVVLEAEPSGRLVVVGHDDIAISLSHTRGLAVACATSAGPVGIDVEPLDRQDLPRSQVWLTPVEAHTVASLDPYLRRLALLHLWVAKEAVIKALPGPDPAWRRRIHIACGGDLERCRSLHGSRVGGASGSRLADSRGCLDEVRLTAHAGGPREGRSSRGVGRYADTGPPWGQPDLPRDLPVDARRCGSGRAVHERPPNERAPSGGVQRLQVEWYALDDRYLVALALPDDGFG